MDGDVHANPFGWPVATSTARKNTKGPPYGEPFCIRVARYRFLWSWRLPYVGTPNSIAPGRSQFRAATITRFNVPPQPSSYPLSPLQEGMLFHWLRDRHSGTDVEQITADLHEDIDAQRFNDSWQKTLATFDTLRTAFAWEGIASPVQWIEANASVPFAFRDLSHLPADVLQVQWESFLETDRVEGFDLRVAPAMRVTLFRIAPSHYRMVWSLHHIIVDGRAFELVLNDVFDRYDGRAPQAKEQRPYRDYIDWVSNLDLSPARSYWQRKLSGLVSPTPLPFDDSPQATGAQYGESEVELTADLTADLNSLAAENELTLNTIVMAAWANLLARHSGESDVVFGATKTTRRGTIENAESIVGQFLATIPVRVRVDPQATVREWLRTVREEWVSIRGHEHLPLVAIKETTALPPSVPLFETLIVFESYQFADRLRSQGSSWSARHFGIREQPGLPLTLLAYGGTKLVLKLNFDARRYKEPTIKRLLAQLETSLVAWTRDVSATVSASRFLPDDEQRALLHGWNDTEADYPDVGVAALVEDAVDSFPDHIAVSFGAAHVTYRDLNARANLLARELVSAGAKAGGLIGVSVERSVEMVVALLAVAKTGSAYVPLDPMFPRDRLQYMVHDSGLRLLITDDSTRASFESFDGTIVPVADAHRTVEDSSNLRVPIPPDTLAYVIYTSGSTGLPKGVQIPSDALVNLLWSMRAGLSVSSTERLLAVTTISFDIAALEIWMPLISGARTIIADRSAAVDGDALVGSWSNTV